MLPSILVVFITKKSPQKSEEKRAKKHIPEKLLEVGKEDGRDKTARGEEGERNYPVFHLKHSFLALVVVGEGKEFHILHDEMNAYYYIVGDMAVTNIALLFFTGVRYGHSH